MATIGTVTPIRKEDGCWAQTRTLGTGHQVVFYPDNDQAGAKRKRLYLLAPNGAELGWHGDNVRDFSVNIDPATGEIWVRYSAYNDNKAGWYWTDWRTGVKVATTATPPPATGNAAIVAAIQQKLKEAEALLAQIR